MGRADTTGGNMTSFTVQKKSQKQQHSRQNSPQALPAYLPSSDNVQIHVTH